MAETIVRMGGYQGARSVHTRAARILEREFLQRAGDGYRFDFCEDVTALGRPSIDLFSMVEGDELELCHFASSYLAHRVPELAVFDLPFQITSREEIYPRLDGALGRHLAEAIAKKTGFVLLGYWDNGFRHLTNARHPVHVPEDVAGLRVRLQPNRVHEAMVEAWGGIPVAVELSRGIELLMAGEVDAQENPLANTTAYGVDAIHPHVTMTAHLFGARGVYANPRSLEALPAEVADELRIAARDAIAFQRPAAAAFENETREKMAAAGTAFVDPTPDERAAFVAATARVAEWARSEVGEVVPWPT